MKHKRDIRRDYRKLLGSYEWAQFSAEKLEGKVCYRCNSEDELQLHHLAYRDILPWEYCDHELMPLCRSCHDLLHRVADSVWVEMLRFEPHALEVLLKKLRSEKDPHPDLIKIIRSLNLVKLVDRYESSTLS